MRTPKVRPYIRIRSAGGKYTFHDPVWNKNRTLRPAYALVNRQPECHPEGVYYLRYLRGTKRVWHAVGADADAALVALRNKEHDLQAVRLGRSVEEPTSQPICRLGLGSAVESYLAEIRRSRSSKTIAACNRILGVFRSRLYKVIISDNACLTDSVKPTQPLHNALISLHLVLRSDNFGAVEKYREGRAAPNIGRQNTNSRQRPSPFNDMDLLVMNWSFERDRDQLSTPHRGNECIQSLARGRCSCFPGRLRMPSRAKTIGPDATFRADHSKASTPTSCFSIV